MDRCYLIKYGLTGEVGRFAADGQAYDRGQVVVLRSWRGTELGEILIDATHLKKAPDEPASHVAGNARILRAATDDDLRRASRVAEDRDAHYETCAGVFRDGAWPIDLIDVEPLLDDRRAVLHYLGPHGLDTAGLLAAFRARCDLDVMFQPVGRDAPAEAPAEPDVAAGSDQGCGSCGEGGGCGTSGKGACSGCAVKKLMTAAR